MSSADSFKAEPVKVRLPKWIAGGDPQRAAEICGLDAEATSDPGVWRISTKEGKYGKPGKLVVLYKLADRVNHQASSAYGRIHRLKRYNVVSDTSMWNFAAESQQTIVNNFSDEPAALIMSMRFLVLAARSAEESAQAVQKLFSDYVLPVAENASVHLIETSDHLSMRYALSRALLASETDAIARQFEGSTTEQFEKQSIHFRSSTGLFQNTTVGLGAYLRCMCASLSPNIWAYTIDRPGAVVLVLFGGPLTTKEQLVQANIDLLASDPNGSTEHLPIPADPKTYLRAAQWWVKQLNTLFWMITEPENYSNDGFFDAAESIERLLSVEQLFQDCLSILTITRDDHAKQALTFSLLKRLEGLVPGHNWRKVVGINSLEKILEQLRADLPREVQEVFLPRAERALEAVRSMEAGFFYAEDSESPIPLPDDNNSIIFVKRSTAVTDWLLVIRNSVHGFDKPDKRDRALLASHDGNIPSTFADVAWLHLLDFMAHPKKLTKYERKRGMSARKSKVSPSF